MCDSDCASVEKDLDIYCNRRLGTSLQKCPGISLASPHMGKSVTGGSRVEAPSQSPHLQRKNLVLLTVEIKSVDCLPKSQASTDSRRQHLTTAQKYGETGREKPHSVAALWEESGA